MSDAQTLELIEGIDRRVANLEILESVQGSGDLDFAVPAITAGAAYAEGAADFVIRSDAVLQAGIPVDIGNANAAGVATDFVRRDHIHNHPKGLGVDLHHDPVTLGNTLAANLLGIAVQHLTLDLQAANLVFAGPVGGGAAAPAFRALVAADLPAIGANWTRAGTVLHPTTITDQVGIGTITSPHGAVGMAKFAIDGTVTSSVDGPHVQFTISTNNYPTMQIFNWDHDNIGVFFDLYYDGTNWRSSDPGSNFMIYKTGDKLQFVYAAGHAAGAVAAVSTGFELGSTGDCRVYNKLYMRTGSVNEYVWSNAAGQSQLYASGFAGFQSGATDFVWLGNSLLYPVPDNGIGLGMDSNEWIDVWAYDITINHSDLRDKDNVIDSPLGLDFINRLRPIAWNWKDKRRNKRHHGFGGQDVHQVMQDMGIADDDFDGHVIGETTGKHHLRYAEFIAPLTAAVQELARRVEELEVQE